MDIIVCIKQVPNTTEVKIDPVKNTLIRDGVESIVNPFDMNATEAALKLREAHGGKVTVLTMGPPQAVDALRECLALGADEAVLISDRAFAGADTWATSYALAKAIQKIGLPQVILCGKQAIDGDTAQVGPGIAEHLNLPQVTYVQKISYENDKIVAERAIEGGYEVISVPIPVMIAVDKAIGEPRIPSIMNMKKALKKEVTVLSAVDIEAPVEKIGLNGSCTLVKRIFSPERKSQGEMLVAGSDEGLCDLLIQKLREAKVV